MFDYVEFTRILKHGAKDPDDKWSMSHPMAGLAAKVTSKASTLFITSFEHCQMQKESFPTQRYKYSNTIFNIVILK